MSGVDYVLAQVNIGRLLAPIESPRLADFAAGLDPVNAVADSAPGFVSPFAFTLREHFPPPGGEGSEGSGHPRIREDWTCPA